MTIPRKYLPPMQMLRAFEACARLSNFTAAAHELNLTQSAISRQVRGLEEMLGADLFVREKQTARVTVAGEAYAAEVRQALQRLASATLSFRANPQGGALRLAILPTFGTRWLAPRLPKFLDAHPGITINLVTRLSQFDFRLEPIDAAIHYGVPDWPGAEMDFLMAESVVPACSAAFKERHGISRANDLLDVPLLHLVSRPEAWETWFDEHNVQHGGSARAGMLIDQFSVAKQAAVSGLGVALLPTFLFQGELERGDLVSAVDPEELQAARAKAEALRSARNAKSDKDDDRENSGQNKAYYLAWPSTRAGYPPLEHFRTWLQEQMRAELETKEP